MYVEKKFTSFYIWSRKIFVWTSKQSRSVSHGWNPTYHVTYAIYPKIFFQAQAEKAKAKPKKKSVGFAEPNEDENDEEVIHEPKEESKYLPETKPKPILKSETIYDEALQGSSFNTPKPQRKASSGPKNNPSPKMTTQNEEQEEDEEETSDEDEDESTESEEETETER